VVAARRGGVGWMRGDVSREVGASLDLVGDRARETQAQSYFVLYT
jgi:hypothetical protein